MADERTLSAKFERLLETYGQECSAGNEYDNRPRIAEAKKAVLAEVQRLREYEKPDKKMKLELLTNPELDATRSTFITDPRNHGRLLWVIFGEQTEPQIMCCKLLAYTVGDYVCIWGYSVWRGTPGFWTLGIDVKKWCSRSTIGPYFYADQERALEHLRRLTTPKAGAL